MFNNQMFYNHPLGGDYINQNLYRRPFHFNWKNILNNTQKTLNVINQAIPVYYQIKPIYNNAKTMLRMVTALKDDDNNIDKNEIHQEKKNTSEQGPVFFV